MFCPVRQRRFSELSAHLEKTTLERFIPYSAAMDLTYRCNQACCHCYCNLSVNDRKRDEELTLEEIKGILDQMAEAGCFWLLLTGGEVMVREDFVDIYIYAARKGLLIDVFTNATLMTEEIAEIFAQYPPLGVDVTLYGSRACVHDRITRQPGSFERTMKGVRLLSRYGVPFSLKTIIMTLNYHDFENMGSFSKKLGKDFRFDCFICPRVDGRDDPLAYRLSPVEVVGLELKDSQAVKDYEELFALYWKKDSRDLFVCAAGVNSFNIDPYGVLSPCAMFSSFRHSLREMPLKKAWEAVVDAYGKQAVRFVPPGCKTCAMLWMCPSCPAWAEIESKKIDARVEYICDHSLTLEKRLLEKTKEERDAEKALSKTGD